VRDEYGIAQESSLYRIYTKEIKLDAGGSPTSELQTNFFDMVGRVYKTVYSDLSSSASTYDNFAHLVKEQDPDNVTTLYQSRETRERRASSTT